MLRQQIIKKFNSIHFDRFKININDHPTLSSHAFRLFRTHFMKADSIPMIYGDEYQLLRTSYIGGATDMYIPTNSEKELVYGYDINSLYPYIMANFPMPTGNLNYFEGNIRKIDPNAFGFFYCNITTPSNLLHPILQTQVKTKNGLRTIATAPALAGAGIYKDLIFSPEIDNAMKFGYKFEILGGFTYDQAIIFKDYVDTLYQMRLEVPKDDPRNFMAKLNLNSLYGKFGQKDTFDITKIITC